MKRNKLKRLLKGYLEFWLFAYYVEFNASARCKWSSFKIHKPGWFNRKDGFYRHLVWGKLSLMISQPQLEIIRVCSDCEEPIEVKSFGDESWDYCEGCQQVEGKTHEISQWDWENVVR